MSTDISGDRFIRLYNGGMKTVYTLVHSPEHTYPGHPEEPNRFSRLQALLDRLAGIERLESGPASREEIAAVHSAQMIAGLEEACKRGPGIIDFAPTYVTQTSYDDALNAAGGTLGCTRAVLKGEAQNGFAIVRPPGHHAEPERAMGFCLFNNLAVAARDALANGVERLLVVDYDAHHGNGTQAAFWHDERLAYFSTHQEYIYPGTGRLEEAPHARGRIANFPLPAHAGDKAFAAIAEQAIKPLVETFRPQMMLVSAGFDAHWKDPIATLGLSTAGFHALSRRLVELAEEHCQGKIVFALEGGYDPQNVANGAAAVFAALTGTQPPNEDDMPSFSEADIGQRLEAFRRWHGL
jgi:acetoin utilization deacetylase AcuC-like enzyme